MPLIPYRLKRNLMILALVWIGLVVVAVVVLLLAAMLGLGGEPPVETIGGPLVIVEGDRPFLPDRGYMGIVFDRQRSFQQGRGLVVKETLEKGPARQAGMRAGDEVISINGQSIRSIPEYATVAVELKAGQTARLEFLRKGETQAAEVVLTDASVVSEALEVPSDQ